MGYMTDGLTFNTLRSANVHRLPLFKNKQGEAAHSKADGSDWTEAEWFRAVVGELGELANLQKKIARGDFPPILAAEVRQMLEDEFADVQIYFDILAFRCGIDLGRATISKWNEKSRSLGLRCRIRDDGSDWQNLE